MYLTYKVFICILIYENQNHYQCFKVAIKNCFTTTLTVGYCIHYIIYV